MEALKTKKILLVDDDQSIRLSLFYYFGKKCAFFGCRETAEQALEHLQKEAYDIIICDYRLPGMDGLSFFQELHRLEVPVLKVLITAFGNMELAIEAIKAGVHDFILKPFNAHTVEQSLLRLIEKYDRKTPAILVDGKSLEETSRESRAGKKSGLGKLHHRINNVLQSMLGNADMGLMELGQDNPAVKRFDRIIDSIENMMELVKEIDLVNTSQKSESDKSNVVGPNQYVVGPKKKISGSKATPLFVLRGKQVKMEGQK
ncbi:MAG: response regulator [Syntrophales bacterium]|nr:response regulator [Syntrophales bacterium]